MEEGMNFPILLAILELWPLAPLTNLLTDTLSCANLAIQNRHLYPATGEAAERFLLLPVSTADYERGFSKQNLIKKTLRNCLSTSSLDNLMQMSVDGPFCV